MKPQMQHTGFALRIRVRLPGLAAALALAAMFVLFGAPSALVTHVLPTVGDTLAQDGGNMRDSLIGAFGDAVLEAYGDPENQVEAARIREKNTRRYVALDQTFSKVLADAAELEQGLWELHPDVVYFRAILTQTALNGELTCERGQQCTLMKAGVPASSSDSSVEPYCGDMPEMCDRQYQETMSSCNAILNNRCNIVLEPLCRVLRSKAYKLCKDVADCQFDCCMRSCLGTERANWAASGKQGTGCVECQSFGEPM